jgi:glucokinase
MLILAGDIGGTKTDLAIFSTEQGPRRPLAAREYPSARYASLEVMVREFLAATGLTVEAACFDVAGPVVEGRAELTNLPWVLQEEQLASDLGLRAAHLLNDLEAIATAVPLLHPADLHTLSNGDPEPGGAIGVVAPGTGLGEAFLTWNGSSYEPRPSEGGHSDFAPLDELQDDLLRYLRRQYEHVSYERVCSGRGIPNLYDFLRDTGRHPESPDVAVALAAAADRTPPIVAAAVHPANPCPLCVGAIELFVRILGAEAGNLALKVLATGGIYLGGGLPRRVLPLLDGPSFLAAFQAKGRLSDFTARLPVHAIVTRAAILGAASHGLAVAEGPGTRAVDS